MAELGLEEVTAEAIADATAGFQRDAVVGLGLAVAAKVELLEEPDDDEKNPDEC